MKKSKSILDISLPILFMAALLVIWELVINLGGIQKYIMPAPSDIALALVRDFNAMVPHIMATLYESVVGFSIAVALALILAIVMDLMPMVKKAVYPVFIVSQTVPVIALAPLFIIWFGFGALPKIIVVVIVCFFPIKEVLPFETSLWNNKFLFGT